MKRRHSIQLVQRIFLLLTGAGLLFYAGYFVGGENSDCSMLGASPSRGSEPLAPASTISSAVSSPESELRRASEGEVVFEGMCDASGAVPVNEHQFAVVDDEANLIRLYDADRGGPPLRILHAAPRVSVSEEADLEAATRIGDEAFWIGSHGRNKKGKPKPERVMLFGTSIPNTTEDLRVIGEPYRDLLEDLGAAPALERYGMREAATLPPQAEGALNLEGLTATPRGGALLGFRNPIIEGKALLVEIENLPRLAHGERARFGEVTLLPLGGLGIRGLSFWRGDYLVVGGPRAEGESKLFRWGGPGEKPREVQVNLKNYNPEGFFTPEEREQVLVLSDDGAREIEGEKCKSLDDVSKKRFRGLWLLLGN